MKIFLRILSSILIFLLALTSGCTNTNRTPPVPQKPVLSQETSQFLENESIDDDLRAIMESTATAPIPASSFDKIEEALSNDEITEEEAVLYSLQVAFDPSSLPGKYIGSDIGTYFEVHAELQWVLDNWNDLSEKSKEVFKPFILPPDNPDSIFSPEKEQTRKLSFIPRVNAASNDWKKEVFNIPGSSNTVEIKYFAPDNFPQTLNDQMKSKAIKVKKAFEKAWPKFKNLLGVEPSKSFEVKLGTVQQIIQNPNNSNTGMVGVNGFALWDTSAQNCRIVIEENLEGKELESTAVHELFHCFQFHMGLTFYRGNNDLLWVMEATAVWSENFVYPKYNTEHEYLEYFFKTLNVDRVNANKKHEYSSYLLFYFLSQYLANDRHVTDILRESKNGDIRMAVMGNIEDYAETYSEFALYNWNRSPWKLYKDNPSFPDNSPDGNVVETLFEIEPGETEYVVTLNKGSMKYNYHHFNDDVDKIRKVVFDFTTPAMSEFVRRQALIKVGDTWTNEDWNGVAKKEFCRRNESENVKAVIVIVSNADLENTNDLVYSVNTEEDCKATKTGYTRITQSYNTDIGSFNAVFESNDKVEYVPDEYINGFPYKLKERSMSFSYSGSGQWEWYAAGMFTGTTNASGSLTETYSDPEEMPTRFIIKEDGSIKFYAGPDTKNHEWVTYNETLKGPNSNQRWTEKGDERILDLHLMNFDLEESEIQNKKIKGSRTFDVIGPFGPVKTTVEFEYDIP